MSFKVKILNLLEEMGGLCLDNELERMEVAARLADGLFPASAANDEITLDDLIMELAAIDPLNWELVDGARSLVVGTISILLRNFHNTMSLEMLVCGQPMLLSPQHRAQLFKMCNDLRDCERTTAIRDAVRGLRFAREHKGKL